MQILSYQKSEFAVLLQMASVLCHLNLSFLDLCCMSDNYMELIFFAKIFFVQGLEASLEVLFESGSRQNDPQEKLFAICPSTNLNRGLNPY